MCRHVQQMTLNLDVGMRDPMMMMMRKILSLGQGTDFVNRRVWTMSFLQF